MSRLTVCVAVATLFVNIGIVQAAPIHFKFDGMVFDAFADPDDPFGGAIDFGTSMSGVYTFDTTAVDLITSSDNVGVYSFNGSPYGMTIDIGGVIFDTSETLTISVANDIAGVDQYTVLAQQGTPGGLDDFLSMELFLEDWTGTAFSNDDLLLDASVLDDFIVRDFFMEGVQTIAGTTYQFQVQGITDTFTVPEPTPILLIGIGLAGLSLTRRRQKRQQFMNNESN